MGLNLTHGCFDGSYHSYHRWKNVLAVAAGYALRKFSPMGGSFEIDIPDVSPDLFTDASRVGAWLETPEDPLVILFTHSDMDGIIQWKDAVALADRLDGLEMPEGYQEETKAFSDGLRLAASKQENVEY